MAHGIHRFQCVVIHRVSQFLIRWENWKFWNYSQQATSCVICFSCCSLQQMPRISNSFSAPTFNVYSIAACGSSNACVGGRGHRLHANLRNLLGIPGYSLFQSIKPMLYARKPLTKKTRNFDWKLASFVFFLTKLRGLNFEIGKLWLEDGRHAISIPSFAL